MVRRLEEALGVSGEAKNYLVTCNHLIMLAHSCSSPAELRQLGELLDCPLPAGIEAVRLSLGGVDWKSTRSAFVDWFVIEKTETGLEQDQAKVPGLLRLFRAPDDGGQMMGLWRYMVNSQLLEQSPETGYTRCTDLMAELDRRFVFVCAEPAFDTVRVRLF
jgi:hypothetical protein